MHPRWMFTPGAVFSRELPGIRSDGTPERRPVPPRRQDLDRASGSDLSHEERVSDPRGAPNFIIHDEKKDGLQSVENNPIDADARRRMQMHIHGEVTRPCATIIVGRTEDEENLVAHEVAAAKRRHHYNVYSKGGAVEADPARFLHPQNYVAAERRRENHERWKPTAVAKEKANKKQKESTKA